MSGRLSHTRRRLALVTAATVVAMPLGVAMAGSAHADTLGGLGGLDTSAVSGLLGNSGVPVVGDLLGGVTGGTSAADPTAALSPVTSAADTATAGTPAEGVMETVTGLAGGGNSAKAIKSAATPDAISSLMGNPTGALGSVTGRDLPVVGNLGGGALGPVTSLLGPVTSLLAPVTGLVGGLLGTVTGLVGGVTGGLLGGGLDSDIPTSEHNSHHSRGGDDFESNALPHTGANTDATALMLCAGMALAGTGVTLVSRRRRGALAV